MRLARDHVAATPSTWQNGKDKKKKKTKKRKVAKRKGPRTLLGRLRADERAQMTVDALLLRERSILQAEAGFLTVELRKLKRRRKLERAAARRAAGAKVKDAIDSDERAIVKALDDERKAAKAASVYESDPKRREALEAKVDEARATRNAAFKHAVPALKERLDYNQACLDKCRRWRAKLSEKPDEPLHEEEEAKKEDPLMDKLREKGLGTFRERYQRTLGRDRDAGTPRQEAAGHRAVSEGDGGADAAQEGPHAEGPAPEGRGQE